MAANAQLAALKIAKEYAATLESTDKRYTHSIYLVIACNGMRLYENTFCMTYKDNVTKIKWLMVFPDNGNVSVIDLDDVLIIREYAPSTGPGDMNKHLRNVGREEKAKATK